MNRSLLFASVFSLVVFLPTFSADQGKQVELTKDNPSSVPKAAWGLLDALYNGTTQYINKTIDPSSYISNTTKSYQVYQNALEVIDIIESGKKPNSNDMSEISRQIKHRSGALVDLVYDAIQKGDSITLSKYLEKPTVYFMPPILQDITRAYLLITKETIDPQFSRPLAQPK